MSSQNYQDYRREYEAKGLRRDSLSSDPWQQFSVWLKDAESACPLDATSMTLATVSEEGMPNARIVLLKSFSEKGLVWYSDQRSQKGQDLSQNAKASVLFYWQPLERQVRVSGTVTVVPKAQSDQYFSSRPRQSQLSAAATAQSQVVSGLSELEENVSALENSTKLGLVARPEAWVGFCLDALKFEFWQGRPSRLHDRFRYQKQDSAWSIDRLAP